MTVCNDTAYNDTDNRIERILRKTIIFVIIMAFLLPLITPEVFAASGVTISGGDNVKDGETFTVAVTYGGGNVGRVVAQMTYDTDKLTYISGGSSSGNTGYIQLKNAGTGEALVFNIKFRAVSGGNAELKVTTNEMYNLDEEYMANPSTSKTISILGSADKNESAPEMTTQSQMANSTQSQDIDKKDEAEKKSESAINSTTVLIIAAVIAAALIAIIAAILISKRKKNGHKR